MWSLIYLMFFNAGLGFLTAMWLHERIQFVQRYVRRGFDFKYLCPPSSWRRLRRRILPQVDAERVCQKLNKATVQAASNHDIEKSTVVPGSATQRPQSTTMSGENTPGSAAGSVEGLPNAGQDANALGNSAGQVDSAKADDKTDAASAGQASDVSVTHPDPVDMGALETNAGPTGESREWLDEESETDDARVLQNASEADREAQSLAGRAETERESETMDGLQRPAGQETTALESSPVVAREIETLDAPTIAAARHAIGLETLRAMTKPGAESTDESRFMAEPITAIEGNFLHRAVAIDQVLLGLIENPAVLTDQTMEEMVAQIQDTHNWWTRYEPKVSQALESAPRGDGYRPEQRAQVEDDLVEMQASLSDCQRLLEQVGIGRSTESSAAAAPEWAGDLRTRMIETTRVCHRLRDNLVLLMPDSPLRFNAVRTEAAEPDESEPQAKPVAFVQENGVAGTANVVKLWKEEIKNGGSTLASMILVDFDRVSEWNRLLGLDAMDWVLERCHLQLAGLIRSNRGFDRVVRVSGQQFLVFLGATMSRDARFAAERIRQSFANTEWEVAGRSFHLHASAVVGPFHDAKPLQPQLAALRQGLPSAKRLGGNAIMWLASSGQYQEVSGMPNYDLPPRTHSQPRDMWKPSAVMS